jgi:hypothetical protein
MVPISYLCASGTEGDGHMAKIQPTPRSSAHVQSERNLTRDEIYETLSNRRRRYALHYLMQRAGEHIALSDLAAQIAAWENGGNIDGTTSTERRQVYTALQQFHLPKMEEMAIVAYDQGEGTVELTDAGADLDVYLDVIRGSDIPWSLYYVGFSAASVVLAAAVVTNIYPIHLLPTIAWVVFLVAVLCISSLMHLYDTRAKKLGAEGSPPEVGRG